MSLQMKFTFTIAKLLMSLQSHDGRKQKGQLSQRKRATFHVLKLILHDG